MLNSRRLKILFGIIINRSELGLVERAYVAIRWVLTPYHSIVTSIRLSDNSQVLDLASGHGLLAELLSFHYPQAKIFGIDHDPKRIL